jgi:hypothetical protein
MLIYEILARKRFLNKKLVDLNNYLNVLSDLSIQGKSDLYNKAIEEKFTLLNKIQSHEVLLQEQNMTNIISIADNDLTVYDAVKLKNTLLEKMKTLDTIISSGDFEVISVFRLMSQRDLLFEEFLVFENAISKSDITTTWEKD